MPQLDPAVFLPQIFWLALLFGLIYLFIAHSATPRITQVLERRQDRITSDLEDAERLQAEADEARAVHEKAMEEARARALSVVTAKKTTLKRDMEIQYSKLTGELAADGARAEQKIIAARGKALDDIRAVSIDFCRVVIRRVSGLELDEKIVTPRVNSNFDAMKEKVGG